MLHLWSQQVARHTRQIARLLSVSGCALWVGAALLIVLVGDARSSQAQEPDEVISPLLIDPFQVTPIRPGQAPAEPTSAPSPEPTQQAPVPEATPPPAPSIAPTAPVTEPPAPTSAPPAPVAPTSFATVEPPVQATLPPRSAEPIRTRVIRATPASSPTRRPVAELVLDPVAPSPQPRGTGASVATPTPAAVAAVLDVPEPIDVIPAAPPESIVEASEAALPPPSLETANIVYASGLRRVDARRYAISACIANVGLGREADLEINVRVRARGARIVDVRSGRAAVSIMGRTAQIRPEPLDASGAQQIDVLVESDALLSARDIAVSATQARWLAGRVRLVCEPGPASAAVVSPRFLVDGSDVRVEQAVQLLRVNAPAHVAAGRAWVVGVAGWSSLMLAAGAMLLASGAALWFSERLWL